MDLKKWNELNIKHKGIIGEMEATLELLYAYHHKALSSHTEKNVTGPMKHVLRDYLNLIKIEMEHVSSWINNLD